MQGPIAVALGGWDLSWLAGGLTSAAVYAILGPRQHIRYLAQKPAAGLQAGTAPGDGATTDSTPALPAR
jgi:toxin CptA